MKLIDNVPMRITPLIDAYAQKLTTFGARATAYDTETHSMEAPQRLPRAESQSYPTLATTADADGSMTVAFSPKRPADTPEGNWIQTTEGKGWFVLLRLNSQLAPFFDKSWRPSEIEAVKTNP